MTAIIETALVDGTDLADFGVIEDLGGLYATGGRRGSNYVVPGRDGEIHVPKPRGSYAVSIGLTLYAVDPDTGAELADDDARTRRFNQAWLDLVALCDPADGLVVLTRRLSLPGGVTLDQTCSAEITGGMSPSLLNLVAGRVVLPFTNLDGSWSAGTSS
ncbi:MAG: hypothetical protein AB7I38_14470 [Dehalococcoidia bacterium]